MVKPSRSLVLECLVKGSPLSAGALIRFNGYLENHFARILETFDFQHTRTAGCSQKRPKMFCARLEQAMFCGNPDEAFNLGGSAADLASPGSARVRG